ncbi:MAG: pyruvate kinase [Deltaproteobacteria bacterium]|nr:pyruvate kinase [Deltaproteobacteria bacterium]
MRRTKIVCTIGPASQSPETLRQLIEYGMNVARLNFSHGTAGEHLKKIDTVRELSRELGEPIAILQDLAGPKIRIGEIATGEVMLKPGSRFIITNREVPGDEREVSVSYASLPEEVSVEDTLLLADGALELKVIQTDARDITCEVVVGGALSSHKGINLPTATIKAPALTHKDVQDISFGIAHGVDMVALSFVKDAQDVLMAKQVIHERSSDVPVIAKIEKHEALKNIDAILESVDGIMVARGDLGVESPLERIPQVQKMLIRKANALGKPVITATQMLRSMVNSPRPTRAEATDVANAILDGSDAVMLSEETAVGKYPAEAVRFMAKIAEATEEIFPHEDFLDRTHAAHAEVEEAIGYAACCVARDLNASAIITSTQSGSTARRIAKHRPKQPILAISPDAATVRRLALSWGLTPLLVPCMRNVDEMIKICLEVARPRLKGLVVITAGTPLEKPGTTNLIQVERVE